MAKERKNLKIKEEVTQLLADRFHTTPVEWHTDQNFSDGHGCDGYIFKSERAAVRYIYGTGLQICMDYCEGACTEEDWINILTKEGFTKKQASKAVNSGNWKKVVKMLTQTQGPRFFLSEYSGQINALSDGSLLFY